MEHLLDIDLSSNFVRVKDPSGVTCHVVESKKGFKIEIGSSLDKIKQKHLKKAKKLEENKFLLKKSYIVETAEFY